MRVTYDTANALLEKLSYYYFDYNDDDDDDRDVVEGTLLCNNQIIYDYRDYPCEE